MNVPKSARDDSLGSFRVWSETKRIPIFSSLLQ